jgi:hypothetical protein
MYGKLPTVVNQIYCYPEEYCYYLYLPIKFPGMSIVKYEDRIKPYKELIDSCILDQYEYFGWDQYVDSYVYLTIKRRYQTKNNFINRAGWHSDNFKDDSINYIWSSCQSTIFNCSDFILSDDDTLSMIEMEQQANPKNNVTFPDNTLLRLDQYCIHKVGDIIEGVRTFFKLTVSKERFNLVGNSHNYLLDYHWSMKDRKSCRNLTH